MKLSTSFFLAVMTAVTAPKISSAQITNPLMPDTILFLDYSTDATPGNGNMFSRRYARSWSGTLKLLTGARSGSPKVIDPLANSIVANGRLKGRSLKGENCFSPSLSYDAKTILFSCASWYGASVLRYNIFKINVDGTNLVQLTDSPYDETDPCFLPNGRIVFTSTRVGGQARCWDDYYDVPTFVLYSMKDDGSDIVQLAYHETHMWAPSVDNNGMLIFTQWDYVDRSDIIAQHMWVSYPDGRDPRSWHGNYPLPWSTMTGSGFRNGMFDRPHCEEDIRAIPNTTSKYVAIAGAHHSSESGDLIVIDVSIPDDNKVSQVKRITSVAQGPGVPSVWGEAPAGAAYDNPCLLIYTTPWPLSEDYFLVTKNNSIVLIDKNAVEQVVYTSANRPIYPIPLRPRVKPPVLATQTWQGERASLPDHKRATISIMNVNYADLPLPAGRKITSLRVLQILTKTTVLINTPVTGYASEGNCRMSLGAVPVDPDGSVYMEAPVGKLLTFQLLDDKGMAVTGMRAGTYVHAGEQLTCYGCHEDKWKATPPANPTAIRRAPSKLTPEPGAEPNGVTPINYYRLVKPVFDSKCAPCHQKQGKGPASMTYPALQQYAWYWPSECREDAVGYPPQNLTSFDNTTPIHGGSRTTPGLFGAAFSRMGKALLNADHQAAGITPDEFRRVCLWLDGNSMELGAYVKETEQRAGQLVWPDLGYDPANPTGVESTYPLPGGGNTIAGGPFWTKRQRDAADRMIIRDRTLELANPCAGAARVRICDAAGRVIADRIFTGPRISLRLAAAQRIAFLSVYAPDGRMMSRSQVLAMSR